MVKKVIHRKVEGYGNYCCHVCETDTDNELGVCDICIANKITDGICTERNYRTKLREIYGEPVFFTKEMLGRWLIKETTED